MCDHVPVGPGHDHDVVIAIGTRLDEGDDRAPALDVPPTPSGGGFGSAAAERKGLPATPLDLSREHVGADTRCAPIDEGHEVLCEDLTLAPVPQDHGDGRTTAEVFGLR